MHSLTLVAAREFARTGIRVCAIAPGIFGTPMVLGMPQEVQDSLGASVPFPPRLGRPEEYAAMVQHIIGNTMLNGEDVYRRARNLLDEIRRRSGEGERSDIERDYLERLLERF